MFLNFRCGTGLRTARLRLQVLIVRFVDKVWGVFMHFRQLRHRLEGMALLVLIAAVVTSSCRGFTEADMSGVDSASTSETGFDPNTTIWSSAIARDGDKFLLSIIATIHGKEQNRLLIFDYNSLPKLKLISSINFGEQAYSIFNDAKDSNPDTFIMRDYGGLSNAPKVFIRVNVSDLSVTRLNESDPDYKEITKPALNDDSKIINSIPFNRRNYFFRDFLGDRAPVGPSPYNELKSSSSSLGDCPHSYASGNKMLTSGMGSIFFFSFVEGGGIPIPVDTLSGYGAHSEFNGDCGGLKKDHVPHFSYVTKESKRKNIVFFSPPWTVKPMRRTNDGLVFDVIGRNGMSIIGVYRLLDEENKLLGEVRLGVKDTQVVSFTVDGKWSEMVFVKLADREQFQLKLVTVDLNNETLATEWQDVLGPDGKPLITNNPVGNVFFKNALGNGDKTLYIATDSCKALYTIPLNAGLSNLTATGAIAVPDSGPSDYPNSRSCRQFEFGDDPRLGNNTVYLLDMSDPLRPRLKSHGYLGAVPHSLLRRVGVTDCGVIFTANAAKAKISATFVSLPGQTCPENGQVTTLSCLSTQNSCGNGRLNVCKDGILWDSVFYSSNGLGVCSLVNPN